MNRGRGREQEEEGCHEELAEDEERVEGLALVLSTLVREKEVEVKEEKVMEAMYLQVNALVQQERSRASMKDCKANSFWLTTQDFFLEELLKAALTCIVASAGEVF